MMRILKIFILDVTTHPAEFHIQGHKLIDLTYHDREVAGGGGGSGGLSTSSVLSEICECGP